VIEPLTEQLNWWLGTVCLTDGHVQIIHKYNLKKNEEQ
jgi:hypothetical protein